MRRVTFTVDGEPRGKGRPRFMRTGHTYTDDKTRAYECAVRHAALEAVGCDPIEGPVEVEIRAFMAPPKSASKRTLGEMIMGFLKPTKKPDIDNIVKIVMDGMNGIAYEDDAQVTTLTIRKRWRLDPSVEVIVKEDVE